MAWTNPTTRSTGDLVTAAIWNTDLVDNLVYLHDSLPSCRVYNSANISIPNLTETALTFDSERWDTDNIHSTSSNTSRLTCQTAGKYVIIGHVGMASTVNNNIWVRIRVNGTTRVAELTLGALTTGIAASWIVSAIYNLAAGDYVELTVYQNYGSAVTFGAAAQYQMEFEMHRIG